MPSTSMSRSRQLEDLQARSMPSRRFTPRRSTGRAHRSRQLEPERLDGRSIDRLGAMAKPDELPIVQEAARPMSRSRQLEQLRDVPARWPMSRSRPARAEADELSPSTSMRPKPSRPSARCRAVDGRARGRSRQLIEAVSSSKAGATRGPEHRSTRSEPQPHELLQDDSSSGPGR